MEAGYVDLCDFEFDFFSKLDQKCKTFISLMMGQDFNISSQRRKFMYQYHSVCSIEQLNQIQLFFALHERFMLAELLNRIIEIKTLAYISNNFNLIK